MQLGFNTNFRYRGVLFHVQTEDSGKGNPHVITHLFHGGNIMASVKEDYSNLLDGADVEGAVRKLMESMHKTMLHQLSRGEHDEAIGQRLGPEVFLAEAGCAAEAPTVTEEELPAAPVGATVLQPSDTAPQPHSASASPAVSPPAGGTNSGSRLSKVFGDRVISEKPLDEVVLDYLVENARKRKRQPK